MFSRLDKDIMCICSMHTSNYRHSDLYFLMTRHFCQFPSVVWLVIVREIDGRLGRKLFSPGCSPEKAALLGPCSFSRQEFLRETASCSLVWPPAVMFRSVYFHVNWGTATCFLELSCVWSYRIVWWVRTLVMMYSPSDVTGMILCKLFFLTRNKLHILWACCGCTLLCNCTGDWL